MSWLVRYSLKSILLCRKRLNLLYFIFFISFKGVNVILDSSFYTINLNNIAIIIFRFILYLSKIITDFIKNLKVQVLFLLFIRVFVWKAAFKHIKVRDKFRDTLIFLLCSIIKCYINILFQFINIVDYLETKLIKIFLS